MELKRTSLAAIVVLGLIRVACQAQEFSADVVYNAPAKKDSPAMGTAPSPHAPSKIYVGKDMMRLETRGFSGTILLVNWGEHSTVALFPARKEYQALPAGPPEYFRVQDAENACPEWQKAASQKLECEKVGPEIVAGRPTVKYQNKRTSADTTLTAVWIDPALHFVVRWEDTDTGAELHDIKEGPQAADLFALPSNYTILKPLKKAPKGPAPRPR